MMDKYLEDIDKDKTLVNSYNLEITQGTKKMIEDYHNKMARVKNAEIDRLINKYETLKFQTKEELEKRKAILTPVKTKIDYQAKDEYNSKLCDIVAQENPLSSWQFRYKFRRLLSNLKGNSNAELDKINECIGDIVSVFKKANIPLNKDDFRYSTFAYKYMEMYLSANRTDEDLKDCFNDIYWSCPDFIMHIKLALLKHIRGSEKELKTYLPKHLKESRNELGISSSTNVKKLYKTSMHEYEETRRSDEYKISEKFISRELQPENYIRESSVRINILKKYLNNAPIKGITDEERAKIFETSEEMTNLIYELENYNYFKPLIVEINERLKNKDSYKGKFKEKMKEINKVEKEREKIVSKLFPRKTLFGIKPASTDENFILAQNNTIKNLNGLYEELRIAEINDDIVSKLSEASTIEQALQFCTGHYSYFYNTLFDLLPDHEEITVEEAHDRLLRFAYCPFNEFINKTYISEDIVPEEIISKRYQLLGINISTEDLQDNLDALKKDVEFVERCIDIEKANISFEDLILINKIDKLD